MTQSGTGANAPDGLHGGIAAAGCERLHLGMPASGIAAYFRVMRPHQWCKNLLIFLPLIAAHAGAPSSWFGAVIAFFAFCMVASSVYVLNDLLDLAADRAHPRKRHRPLASGAVPLLHGMAMAPALLIAGMLASSAAFAGELALYYGVTLAYSLLFKRKLVIDILVLAGLYTIRILAGAAAAGLSVSPWLLAFALFFFVALAAVKRLAELADARRAGRSRIPGRAYRTADLPFIAAVAIACGGVAVLIVAQYIASPAVDLLYRRPAWLWAVCPVLLYWIYRMIMAAHRAQMDDDPIVHAVRDPVSIACGALVLLLIGAASIP